MTRTRAVPAFTLSRTRMVRPRAHALRLPSFSRRALGGAAPGRAGGGATGGSDHRLGAGGLGGNGIAAPPKSPLVLAALRGHGMPNATAWPPRRPVPRWVISGSRITARWPGDPSHTSSTARALGR